MLIGPQLEIGAESIIYCQKIGAMRYDLSPEPAATSELVPCVYGEEADALNSASVHEDEAGASNSANVREEEADVPNSPGC